MSTSNRIDPDDHEGSARTGGFVGQRASTIRAEHERDAALARVERLESIVRQLVAVIQGAPVPAWLADELDWSTERTGR